MLSSSSIESLRPQMSDWLLKNARYAAVPSRADSKSPGTGPLTSEELARTISSSVIPVWFSKPSHEPARAPPVASPSPPAPAGPPAEPSVPVLPAPPVVPPEEEEPVVPPTPLPAADPSTVPPSVPVASASPPATVPPATPPWAESICSGASREPHAERNAARARASDSTTMRTRASGSTKGTGDDRL